jgi:hypothetical protein
MRATEIPRRIGPKVFRRCATSVECDADAFLLAPHDVAGFAQGFARDAEDKAVREPQRADDFQRGAGRGDVADRARNLRATELHGSGFEDAVTRRYAMVIHEQTIDDPGLDMPD